MSTEKGKRRYEKRRRAEQEEATRRRITEAAVTLHGTVGPARTTISALAREAGVQRATVYRHFPDDASLLAACSAHWATQHPAPDPQPWLAVEDPEERVRTALAAVYARYRGAEPMLTNVLRDAGAMPALREAGAPWRAYLATVEDLLAGGFPGGDQRTLRAAIALSLDFRAWQVLARERDLDDADAAQLMSRAVAANH
jgi:AcrR family transcriptional regulator